MQLRVICNPILQDRQSALCGFELVCTCMHSGQLACSSVFLLTTAFHFTEQQGMIGTMARVQYQVVHWSSQLANL